MGGSASIYLQNNAGVEANLTLWHWSTTNESTGTTVPNVQPGQKIGPVEVSWETSTPADFWYASLAIPTGETSGVYVSSVPEDVLLPYWKECMLMDTPFHSDNGTSPTFTVSQSTFDINLDSGGTSASMLRTGDYSSVEHVFVLMLENHSFDNIFAFSGIPGIKAATTQDSNAYNGQSYAVSDTSTPLGMPTDPGHEFADVLEQLCGQGATYTAPNYPEVTLTGFAANYATSTTEKTGTPTPAEIGDVMASFDTATQLPNIQALAKNFVVCDQWYSSLPGPTWPNRFYVHGASSAYADSDGYTSLDDSPSTAQIAQWETVSGFAYRKGSLFEALDGENIPWRVYHDDTLNTGGSIPQVAALKGISLANPLQVKSITELAGDLNSGYPYRYTFIEPNYGDVTGNTYKGGSSQHPEDSVQGGENLVATVYHAVRNSPLWPYSMLIITYDEHGGFYDSVAPGAAVPPATDDLPGANGFVFNQLGVRVPAVVVSPLVTPGVDHTTYDHSSVLATVERLFGLSALTARDRAANDLTHLLGSPGATAAAPQLEVRAATPPSPSTATPPRTPVPDRCDLQGFLYAARKADFDLAAGGAAALATAKDRGAAVQTHADASAYITNVVTRVQAHRSAHEAAVRAQASGPKTEPQDG
jgi:phospholipase C